MSSKLLKDNMIYDLGTIKAQSQVPILMSATTNLTGPHRRGILKVVGASQKPLPIPLVWSGKYCIRPDCKTGVTVGYLSESHYV